MSTLVRTITRRFAEELQLWPLLQYLRKWKGSVMFNALFSFVFGCSHRHTTFPLTPARKNGFAPASANTYVVCLDCGKEFRYDWGEMRVGQPVSAPLAAARESYSTVNR